MKWETQILTLGGKRYSLPKTTPETPEGHTNGTYNTLFPYNFPWRDPPINYTM
jgi:hypothetical protein